MIKLLRLAAAIRVRSLANRLKPLEAIRTADAAMRAAAGFTSLQLTQDSTMADVTLRQVRQEDLPTA